MIVVFLTFSRWKFNWFVGVLVEKIYEYLKFLSLLSLLLKKYMVWKFEFVFVSNVRVKFHIDLNWFTLKRPPFLNEVCLSGWRVFSHDFETSKTTKRSDWRPIVFRFTKNRIFSFHLNYWNNFSWGNSH